jgi:murein DD-endopeptidase MepM/ murein hydrolase activator NlpD
MKSLHREVLIITIFTAIIGLGGAYYRGLAFNPEPQPRYDKLLTSSQEYRFKVSSPNGSDILTSKHCSWSGNPHEAPACDVQLTKQDGSDAGWTIPAVVFAVWSADGSTFALEDTDHHLYIGSLQNSPTMIAGRYTVPALSPSGRQLAAQKLGKGKHILDQIQNSPGIILQDLKTGSERIIVSKDVYAPFFISEERLGFGSGRKAQLATLYMIDLYDNRVTQLSNRTGNLKKADPFPTAPPIATKDGGKLTFSAIENGQEQIYDLSLRDFTLSLQPNHGAPPTSKNQPEVFIDRELEGSTIDEVDSSLTSIDTLEGPSAVTAKVLFRRPLGTYLGVYQYYDHAGKDWGCGSRRYSGHRGTDYKATTGSPVYAGAAGSLYYKYNGCANTGYFGSTCGGGYGNHARIKHADGRVSIYAHMKKDTIIAYQSVACGRQIGYSASSGSSSTPHLHFEVWSNTSASVRIDPYYGSCDSAGTTDWVSQFAYPNGNVSASCATVNEALPTVTSSLAITPSSPYTVGQTLTARFRITNKGNAAITFNRLLAGGRLNNDDTCAGGCPDFPVNYSITLSPGQYYDYAGNQTMTRAGNYRFFVAYRKADGSWVTSVPADPGVINSVSLSVSGSAAPQISVNPSSGPRGTTFTITGSGFTPYGTIYERIQKPDGTYYPDNTYSANGSGNSTQSWTSSSGSPLGTYYIWWYDVSSGKWSNDITETITQSGCSTTFCVGDVVTVYNTGGVGLRLRSCASTSCSSIVTMPEGTQMTVTGGPSQADGYTWWPIQGNVNGIFRSGWAAGDFLRK